MFNFKTNRGARRFQLIFVSAGLLVFFSRPIWDFILHPVYELLSGEEKKSIEGNRMRITVKRKSDLDETSLSTATKDLKPAST